ncbi:AraC family transcriptional regulator [Bradyrhizobium manausense]|uniref:AraC family transcriptional regulator n=1 Tax=Bradyrhizobium manausense TaxID=989370 RepID=UPI0020115A90|nr:AraC family transcriptional regulator [Bradyrhizobium manausense]
MQDAFEEAPVLSGAGFEDLLASFGAHLFSIKVSPPSSDATFLWRSDISAGQGVSVWRTRYSADWSYSSESPEDDLVMAFLSAGAADITVGTRNAQRTPSTIALAPLSMLRRHQMKAVDGSYANVMLRFDASVVAGVLNAMFGHAPLTKLDLTPTVDLSTYTGQTLLQLSRTIVSATRGQQLGRFSAKAMALLTEAALRLAFESVPHRFIDKLDQYSSDVAPRHIQRAIDYMRANLHHPLTMIDIAAAVGISERYLQLGFRRFRGTTPAMYLRQIRLEAVHAELARPENRLPINEVALKWGFTHMGRFAAQYRATFGVPPSETVKRALGSY